MNVVAIHPNEVDHIWDQVVGYLQRALKYDLGQSDIEEIYKQIKSGHQLLLLVVDDSRIIAAVTAIIMDDRCNIVLAGGEAVEEWEDLILDNIRILAKEQGANRITITGRQGWARRLRHKGFRTVLVTLEEQLP